MSRRKKIYEGKAKILYEGPEPGTLIAHFKDDATAFNNEKHGVLEGKGVLNNRISEFLMQRIEDIGIPTHFIKRINMREQLIREVEIIPLEIVCRNIAAGSICKRLGLKDGEKLSRPIVEYYYKDDDLGDPLVAEEHIAAFNWAGPQEVEDMVSMTLRVNDFLSGLFAAVNIKLVDFKLEFGRQYDGEMVRIILADEISPDSCRLWDADTGKRLDKDRFRQELGGVTDAYAEVAKRLGIMKDQPNLKIITNGDEE
ncbi:MAG: phosphoribosylaminoimidazolesuccinocarboxamide synthase [Robiginitomaculum sp.]|nr:phosphoribosylaminoimidazolesuccinocarboxamide synthase [Robiginitomaculum sp.]MDQ7077328.1 phosphoribosylaminoimidazolesuccinocarboxamide synthase [Robiginitomaculum sp.]